MHPLDGENLPHSSRIVKLVQNDVEDASDDQGKPMIYFDTADLVRRTSLIEEDDDGFWYKARIIEVLNDHEKNVLDNPVLKKFECLIGQDEFNT